jgi:hypothetical protein
MMRPQNRHLKPAQPGEVRNPAGRPKGSKHKLSEAFLRELTEAWEEHGKAALNKLAVEDPVNFVRVAASVIPREFGIEVSNHRYVMRAPEPMTMEDWKVTYCTKSPSE